MASDYNEMIGGKYTMKFNSYVCVAVFAIFLAVVSPALAESIECSSGTPTSIPVTEGASVTLTASPDSSEYTYDWNVGNALTVTAGGDGNYVTFVVPACDATGDWDVQLVMNPTGNSAEACKDTCLYTVKCGGLCGCPSITDACIADSTTWTYDCSNSPESLFYEWWVRTDAATTPVVADPLTWGTKQVADDRVYTPSPTWTGFNVPTDIDPVTHTWVTFIVRQDTNHDGTPDKVIKFCPPEDVVLYFNPSTSMDSVIS
ncbi:MAG TPA: hypothetical protein PKV28_08515 [Methanothrix sp.]|nr:hypothetical protein [Methanothrix sp.]